MQLLLFELMVRYHSQVLARLLTSQFGKNCLGTNEPMIQKVNWYPRFCFNL